MDLQKCYRVLKSIFATAKYRGFKYNIVEMVDNFKNNNSSVKPDEEKLKYITYEQLQQYKQELVKTDNYCEDNYVFGNKRFLPLTTIENHKKKYFKDSNLEDFEITIHEFRHSHVSLLINEYIKSGQTDTTKFFLMMSNRMGHTISVMQETYMYLFPTVQNDIVNLLDNL